MKYNIAVVKGDGIGPEIVSSAMQVLEKIGEKFGFSPNRVSVILHRTRKKLKNFLEKEGLF